MRLFIDTGSVSEVEEIAAWGCSPARPRTRHCLPRRMGDPGEIIRRICDLVGGPVSAEVVSQDPDGMIAEGRALRELHEHVTVKVPFCEEGLAATHALTADGIPVNMTLVFSANQALLAAGAGATYVSCFMGRLDDISVDSGQVVAEIVECFRAGGVTVADHRRLDSPPRARDRRGTARLRDRDRPGQGAAPDAGPPPDHGGRGALPRRLGVPPRVRRVASGVGRRTKRRVAALELAPKSR